MRTLADIKRRAVTGARLEVMGQTIRPELIGTIRTIVKPQTKRYSFTSSHADGTFWGTWPSASEVDVIDADTFECEIKPGPGRIRLRFLPPL